MVSRFPIAEEFVSLRDAMDRLLADSFVGNPLRGVWASASNGSGARMPLPLDVYATENEVVVIAAAPRSSRRGHRDLHQSGHNHIDRQNTERRPVGRGKAGRSWYLHELPHGSFSRSVTLPIEVNAANADATFDQGVLRLRLPKAEKAKPKQIKVRVVNDSAESDAITAGEESR